MTFSMSFGLRTAPSLSRNLKPFQYGSLWDAVIIIPPSALKCLTANSVIGVDAMPMPIISQSKTSNIVFFSIFLEGLVSVPITIFRLLFLCLFFNNAR